MSSPSKIIDKVVSQDKKKQDKTLREFADAFINKLPQEDIDSVSSGELAEIIKQHWALGKARKKGDIKINVTDLTLTTKQGGRPKTVIDVVCDDMAFTINSVAAELTRRGYKMKQIGRAHV